MIIKQSRTGEELARYESEEEAAKANKLTLPLLRSHLNAKKPKYLNGEVYVVVADALEGLTDDAKKEVKEVALSDLPAFVAGTIALEDIASLAEAFSAGSGNEVLLAGPQPSPETPVERMDQEKEKEVRDVGAQAIRDLIAESAAMPPDMIVGPFNEQQRNALNEALRKEAEAAGTTIQYNGQTPGRVIKDELPDEQVASVNDIAARWKELPGLNSDINFVTTPAEVYDGKPIPTHLVDEFGLFPSDRECEERERQFDAEPEPAGAGEEPGLDLRKLATNRLSPPDGEPIDIPDDDHLTPIEKRRRKLRK